MRQKCYVLSIIICLSVGRSLYADPLVAPNSTVVPNDQPYYTYDVGNARLIFTEGNKAVAEKAAGVELELHPIYEQSFGYKLDTQLAVGLMSSYNQIANGFSTQFPRNRQINYIGGAMMPDYFASSSWLLTLLAHETAHNYQLNAKENVVSKTLYTFLGNGYFQTPIIPAITPNLFESDFILEGNAVLNESRHGLGGRLYSGRYRALANVQAQAGYLTKERLYNHTLLFPYDEHFYILGGFYQYYLAEIYGVDAVNHYFKNRSAYWLWPFVVNGPMKQTIGKDFNTTLKEWAAVMKDESKSMKMADGRTLAHSQYEAPLNEQNGKVVFLTNTDGVSRPTLVSYDNASGKLDTRSTGHQLGKVFERDGKFYSVASDNTSVWRIYQGLYDASSHLKEDTKGKVVQGWLDDGRMAYFDTARSFINPQLYVGEEFYAGVDSSVLVKGNDLYYCVQNGAQRTLYRNKTPLYTFEGYYGFPVDADREGHVYFIADSALGSTLFRQREGVVERMLAADNVLDARLTGNDVLVTAVSADGYYYSQEEMTPVADTPYVIHLLWDEASVGAQAAKATAPAAVATQTGNTVTHIGDAAPQAVTLDKPYGLNNNVRYSGGELSVSAEKGDDDQTHTLYDLTFAFADPLTRSSYNVWATRDDDLSNLVGAGFTNNQFFLLVGVQAYHVADRGAVLDNDNIPTRDNGVTAELRLPFIDQGYWAAELATTYFQDYKVREREPASLQLNVSRQEQHGHSFLPNQEISFSAYAVKDRDDAITGGKVHFTFGLPHQFYTELGGQYSDSDGRTFGGINRRGVELSRSGDIINNDPSLFIIPSLERDVFVQRAGMLSAGIRKVFDFSHYFFRFPTSLRREGLLIGYRHYNINDDAGNGKLEIGQSVVGIDLDTLVMNVLPITFSLEAVYNDNTALTKRTSVQARVNLAF